MVDKMLAKSLLIYIIILLTGCTRESEPVTSAEPEPISVQQSFELETTIEATQYTTDSYPSESGTAASVTTASTVFTEAITEISSEPVLDTTIASTEISSTQDSDAYYAIPENYRRIADITWVSEIDFDNEEKITITLTEDGVFHLQIEKNYPQLNSVWLCTGTAIWSEERNCLYCTDYTETDCSYSGEKNIIAENGTAEIYFENNSLGITVRHGNIRTSSYSFKPQ